MAQAFVDDYTNMRASIAEYDGFYIGRYELTGTVASPTVQAGAVLTAETAGNWYYIYKACRNVKPNNEYVTSTMIWGCQWDETMNWLGNCGYNVDSNSTSWGNYNNSSENAALKEADGTTNAYGKPQNTGYSKEYWSANKICDLAGNYYEWTQEAWRRRQPCLSWAVATTVQVLTIQPQIVTATVRTSSSTAVLPASHFT